MPNIGMGELVVVLLIVLLVFGANRLPQIGDGIGKAIKNFKRGMNSDDAIEVTPQPAKRVAANASGSKLEVDDAQDAEVVERKNG
jgi:sec-independent protein translocase protein TatA